MRILIVGAGALGGLVGAFLTRAGEDVTLLEANAARAHLLNTGGLQIVQTGGGESISVRPRVVTSADGLEYRFRRRPAKAILRIRQAVEQAVSRPYCWYVQGCCEMELGLYPSAKRSFLQCLELKPGHLEARRQLDELEHERWSLMTRIKRWFRRK